MSEILKQIGDARYENVVSLEPLGGVNVIIEMPASKYPEFTLVWQLGETPSSLPHVGATVNVTLASTVTPWQVRR